MRYSEDDADKKCLYFLVLYIANVMILAYSRRCLEMLHCIAIHV